MMKERGISPFGVPFIQWHPACYGGSLSLPPVICRSYTGRSFRSLGADCIRAGFLDCASGPIDAPDQLPAGSHLSERITVGGHRLMRKAETIYAGEIAR